MVSSTTRTEICNSSSFSLLELKLESVLDQIHSQSSAAITTLSSPSPFSLKIDRFLSSLT